VLTTLVSLEGDSASSEDLKTKCRRALKSIIGKLTHLPALDALVHRPLPEGVMKMVLEQVGSNLLKLRKTIGASWLPSSTVLCIYPGLCHFNA
jgi:hypothetical protein